MLRPYKANPLRKFYLISLICQELKVLNANSHSSMFDSPAAEVRVLESPEFHTFSDWCLHQKKLPADAKHTVKMLMELVETDNCDRANFRLQQLQSLNLGDRKISDLRPLASLSHLTGLVLYHNQISHLQPLSQLKNLTVLSLSDNQISDL
ncbi:MAG: leucine-rich repeat domain-containing protein, partial [Geitlerinemataceae cyanobacterium]